VYKRQQYKTVNNHYYHGTQNENIVSIMKDQPQLNYHGEMQIDTFSVSTNSNMLRYFGEGHGSGFIFPSLTLNLIDIPDFYYYLMAYGTGMSEDWLDDPQSELYQKAVQLGFKTRFGDEIGIENQQDFINNVIGNTNVDGLIIFEEGTGNSEDETALLQSGLDKAFNSDYTILYEGEEYSKNEFMEGVR
jgi:hypothetical protein